MIRRVPAVVAPSTRFFSRNAALFQAPHAKIIYTKEYYASLKKEPKKDDLKEVVEKWDEQFKFDSNENLKQSKKSQSN